MLNTVLVNDPFGDPGLYVECKYRRDAFLFDLGDISTLPPRKILKIKHIFVSHTHMDHFIGFDHLLRICLGRNHHVSLFGPPDFLERVEHKLRSYTWNLVGNYENDFALSATEIGQSYRVTRLYQCHTAFRAEGERAFGEPGTPLLEDDLFLVTGILLDHGIPCLAYRLQEKTRLNIKKNALQHLGLPTGAWLNELKNSILKGEQDDTPIRIWWKNREKQVEEMFLPLGIVKNVVVQTPGHTICYITDVRYSDENIARMVELAKDAEILFIEAPFLHCDADRAAAKHHLTANQAGTIAYRAGVKRLSVFHFSPKYRGYENSLFSEAMESFHGKKYLDNDGYIL